MLQAQDWTGGAAWVWKSTMHSLLKARLCLAARHGKMCLGEAEIPEALWFLAIGFETIQVGRDVGGCS